MTRNNGGKSSRMVPPRIDQRQIQAALAQARQQQGPVDEDTAEVQQVVKVVTELLAKHNMVCEAQVVFQGGQIVSNVIFRKADKAAV